MNPILIFFSQLSFAAAFFFLGMAVGSYKLKKTIHKIVEKEIDKQITAIENPYIR